MEDLPQEVRTINSWGDLDRALLALRVTEAQIAESGAEYDRTIQAAQEGKNKVLAPLQRRKERMEQLVEAFTTEHREGLKGKKSIKLVHGKVGFRLGNPKLTFLKKPEETIKLLKQRGHVECVVIKEEIDSAAIKNLAPGERSLCGITTEQKERFFYDLATDPPIVYPDVEDPNAA